MGTLKQLATQLSDWRGILPPDLQWAEDDPTSFPSLQQVDSGDFAQPLDPYSSSQPVQSHIPLFSTDLDKEPFQYPYAYDIQVALLRTRYYQAKYMTYRPFVYKALHFPEQMTLEDAEGVAECLRVRHHLYSSLKSFEVLHAKIAHSHVCNGPSHSPQPLDRND